MRSLLKSCIYISFNTITTELVKMDPEKVPFNALIVGPTNSGKSKFVVDQLYGPFYGKFDFIVLICPTFIYNRTYHRVGEKDPRMYVIVCQQHEVETWLKLVTWLFQGSSAATSNVMQKDSHKTLSTSSTDRDRTGSKSAADRVRNTLIILDDCAASRDVKGRTGQLVELAFSARHVGISVWVLAQKITSITASYRENVAALVLFYTPSAKTSKAIFDDYAGELSHEEYRALIAKLKARKFSYLVFALRFPYGIRYVS